MRVTYLTVDYASHYAIVQIYVKHDGEPVADALVTGEVRSPAGGSHRIGTFTDTDGIARQRVFINQFGDYSLSILNVHAQDDLDFDSEAGRAEISFVGLAREPVDEEEDVYDTDLDEDFEEEEFEEESESEPTYDGPSLASI